jgi:SAM-dependent methyltransferase
MGLVLPSWDETRFNVAPDVELLARLTADMEAHAGDWKPAPGWHHIMPPDSKATMNDMLEPWCGIGAARLGELNLSSPVDFTALYAALCEQYCRKIDHPGLLNGVTVGDLDSGHWRLLDLESLLDFLQISAFVDLHRPRLSILEIGGGFGRLVEFMTAAAGRYFSYVNVDAVPLSLMYSYQYLKARFPAANIRLFDGACSRAAKDCDFLIVPAWRLSELQLDPVDLAINIQSMQEMTQASVNFYIDYLDRQVVEDGIIYLENSREHEFIGDWTFPDRWQCLFRQRTVRSWTIDHPTEVFRKTSGQFRAQNLLRSEALRFDICHARAVQDLAPNDFYSPIGMSKSVAARLLEVKAGNGGSSQSE